MDKLNFLKTEFPQLLRKLDPDAKGAWGVMNGQQMVEHMAESISFATGKNNQKLHTPSEYLEKYKEFAMSDKEFKPNTKNALMAETAAPVKKATIAEAIADVEKEIAEFVDYFKKHKNSTLTNSFFGELNFEEWTHLLHKHAIHHCKQFGLIK
jgi:hypothetical protein